MLLFLDNFFLIRLITFHLFIFIMNLNKYRYTEYVHGMQNILFNIFARWLAPHYKIQNKLQIICEVIFIAFY